MNQKIAVLSDTHGNQKLLRTSLQQEEKLDFIFHLGDNFQDLDENIDLLENRQLCKVPGIYHPGYADGSLQRSKSLEIFGWKFLLVHDIADSRRTRSKHDLVLYGHTHHPAFYQKAGTYYLNPGHLKRSTDRGAAASYCLLIIDTKHIEIIFKNLKNEIIQTYNISQEKIGG